MMKSNPEIDFGFYGSVPRIVRTGYKMLTPIQKWLYTCLKDLCGDHCTCYRTLRTLSLETDLSIGTLSESIPALHEAGLIHAEKKKRSTGGKEVWHITIVDIWVLNGKMYPSKKRSPREQTPENVQQMNKNVHVANKNGAECSAGERECSAGEPAQSYKSASQAGSGAQNEGVRNNNRRKNNTEGRTKKDTYTAPDRIIVGTQYLSGATAPSYDHVYIEKKKPEEDERPHLVIVPPVEQEPPLPAPPPEPEPEPATGVLTEEQILKEWLACCQAKKATKTMRDHTTTLAGMHVVPGEMERCKKWLIDHDLTGFFKDGVHLGSIVQKLDEFRAANQPIPDALAGEAPRPEDPMHDQAEPGMSKATCDALIDEILQHNASISLGVEERNGLYHLGIEIGSDKWIPINKPRDWYYLDNNTVEQAIQYGYTILQQESEKANDNS